MVASPESDKAVRYIQQLDEARCTGRWSDVPELCRKVEKHAPHRKCLTLTARSEASVAAYSTQRPSTAASTSTSGLSQLIPPLLTAIEEEVNNSNRTQDAFQAAVCLGWLHYVLEEPGLAVARLPKDFGADVAMFANSEGSFSGWSRVCAVKGSYLKGSALEMTGAIGDGIAAYSSVIPWLSNTVSHGVEATSQFQTWSEHLLVRLCQLSDQSSNTREYVEPSMALQTYRAWAKFWEVTAKNGGSKAANASKHRRMAWKAYYDTLSVILKYNLSYEPGSTNSTQEKPSFHDQNSARLQQRAELKRVETIYENLLIKETEFPKASDMNQEVETWVDTAIDNWRHLCGPDWTDSDLGEGGKAGLSRTILDLLYRAATKTFHSTQILRYLFVVHASLAEFDLAFKAYESYVEIITRGKDRAEKSEEVVSGIDDDSTVLRTSAEAIRILCRFGSVKEAEYAIEIGNNIEKWLEQTDQLKSSSEAGSVTSIESFVEPTALAVAYCAIGTSQAHWSRLTSEAENRAETQAKAIQYLRKSLSPRLGSANNVEALYALALILAETRDISGAIKMVKRALSPTSSSTTSIGPGGAMSGGLSSEFGRERKLMPLWHLLTLLLTARGDFEAAEKACEAAFEQFGDPSVLFGTETTDAYRSEHLNQSTNKLTPNDGVVDRMETFEKRSILQTKMTQLALLELTDGASAAVDGCDELLALYSRLFGDPAADKAKSEPPATALAPPKSAIGTIRTSIFRGRGSVKALPKEDQARNSVATSSRNSVLTNNAGVPPVIQVIDDEKVTQPNGHHNHKTEGTKGTLGRSPSKLQKRSSASLRRASATDTTQTPEVPPLPETVPNGTSGRSHPTGQEPTLRNSLSSNARKSVESSDRPLKPIAHNMSHASPPLTHSEQPPKQDIRLPTPLPHADYVPPDPHFPPLQDRRQKVSLLSDIWIFIAELYIRAQMFEDAKEAVQEAIKLVASFEAEVLHGSASTKALSEIGWGVGKCVEELWADSYALRGELWVAQNQKHQGREDFERALLHFPDHPRGIVGLSNILLDIYSEVIPLEPVSATNTMTSPMEAALPLTQKDSKDVKSNHFISHIPSAENQLSPLELNRLAARDRAFGLLSSLTKLGKGWDYSEAWFALARAYEESAQVEKTKEVLWWCVELEDTHPVRSWRNLTAGGYVL